MTNEGDPGAIGTVPARLKQILREPVSSLKQLHRGVGGIVLSGTLPSGRRIVVKHTVDAGLDLRVEARMLGLLKLASLPVPEVIAVEEDMLVLDFIETTLDRDSRFEEHAADALARLHSVMSPNSMFGLDGVSYLGSIPQNNLWTHDWVEFFRERRVIPALRRCVDRGLLTPALTSRVEQFTSRLEGLLPNSPRPSLIHGDVWEGNVLATRAQFVVFIDPSPSYSHAEVELAFITLFQSFSRPFFARYSCMHPIDPAFWTERRHVYNVYPLLIHVALFPGEYVDELDQTLRHVGFGPPC